MTCASSPRSRSVFSLALLSSALFWFSLSPIPAQSTTPELPPPDTKPLNAMDFDEALATLRNEISTSLTIFDEVKREAELWRLDSLNWKLKAANLTDEAAKLSSELTKALADSDALSKSLTDSLKREADLAQASQRRADLDAQAVAMARSSRDTWRTIAIVTSATTIAAIAWKIFFK